MTEQNVEKAARTMCSALHPTYLLGPCSTCRRGVAALEPIFTVREEAARAEALGEFADTRGVNVGNEDDDWWRGYRQAQRECAHDAAAFAARFTPGEPPAPGFTVQCREDDPVRHCTVSCAAYRTGHGECPPLSTTPEGSQP